MKKIEIGIIFVNVSVEERKKFWDARFFAAQLNRADVFKKKLLVQ